MASFAYVSTIQSGCRASFFGDVIGGDPSPLFYPLFALESEGSSVCELPSCSKCGGQMIFLLQLNTLRQELIGIFTCCEIKLLKVSLHIEEKNIPSTKRKVAALQPLPVAVTNLFVQSDDWGEEEDDVVLDHHEISLPPKPLFAGSTDWDDEGSIGDDDAPIAAPSASKSRVLELLQSRSSSGTASPPPLLPTPSSNPVKNRATPLPMPSTPALTLILASPQHPPLIPYDLSWYTESPVALKEVVTDSSSEDEDDVSAQEQTHVHSLLQAYYAAHPQDAPQQSQPARPTAGVTGASGEGEEEYEHSTRRAFHRYARMVRANEGSVIRYDATPLAMEVPLVVPECCGKRGVFVFQMLPGVMELYPQLVRGVGFGKEIVEWMGVYVYRCEECGEFESVVVDE